MNLLKMLTNMLTSNAALQALSAKTGLPPKTLKMIIMIAVPLLLKRMTSNASSQTGASSLLGALGMAMMISSISYVSTAPGMASLPPTIGMPRMLLP